MTLGKNRSLSHRFFFNALFTLAGAVLFALANPGFIFPKGIPLVAWVMYFPAFMLVRRSSFKTVWLWGGVYGALSYCLYVSWLVTFHVVAAVAISVEYFFSYALLFLCLKIADRFCGRHAWIAEWLILCSHEYLKTTGFAGFSYGVAGYTQWQNLVLIQSASLFGVWALTFLIDFTSAWLYAVYIGAETKDIAGFRASAKRRALGIALWAFALVAFAAYGGALLSQKNEDGKFIKVCAVQHNTDPWQGDIISYERDVKTLMTLTERALSEDPDIALVVWPETAVVPSILTHYTLRRDRRRFDLIDSVLHFIDEKKAVFVIGNFHSVDTGGTRTDDYNSAFVFTPGKNVVPPEPEIYRKIHLVPFTETVPFAKRLPRLYDALEKADTHLWAKGSVRTVFHATGISFSVPICFEDTFGDDCRRFVANGARAFVNMSNDAWSKSLSCQNQHLAMAVFRCAENRVPAVRSTASGQTCIVDRTGKILLEAEPFTETYLTGMMPAADDSAGKTLYNKTGDALAIFFVAAALLMCIVCIILNGKRSRI
ncbi:apolipoprotein N-acyltransferase [Treponema socranskii]|uniref:apolipoprotein N-acyltransferase n=1 Tax=Treponema socranskii TaxID=53419 RepID=UPI003D8DAE07